MELQHYWLITICSFSSEHDSKNRIQGGHKVGVKNSVFQAFSEP